MLLSFPHHFISVSVLLYGFSGAERELSATLQTAAVNRAEGMPSD